MAFGLRPEYVSGEEKRKRGAGDPAPRAGIGLLDRITPYSGKRSDVSRIALFCSFRHNRHHRYEALVVTLARKHDHAIGGRKQGMVAA
jgi:hypothetical protein